jgi:putative oxidoreductase
MKITGYFNKRSSIAVCIGGTATIVILATIAGLTANKLSRHPLPLKIERKTGIEVIDLARARMLHEQKILFVDARSPEAFNDSHIPDARNFDYLNFSRYFPEFQKKTDQSTPFVVYCEGISGEQNEDTCETSRMLAQQLFDQGYKNVMVFEQGFAFWEKDGYPLDHGTGPAHAQKRKTIPPINYLRDLGMLAIGIAALFFAKKRSAVVTVQLLLGIIFIISASSKIFSPEKLAIVLEAYRILPAALVPYAAAGVPWIELVSGTILVLGILPSAGALVIIGMNLFFIPALTYRMLFLARQLGISVFGVDFDCGCGLGENFAWVLILRDVGFLLMAAAVLLTRIRWTRASDRNLL